MEKYKKGKNVEETLDKSQIPINDLPDDFIWMHVNPGTKMRNVLEKAFEELKTRRAVVWSGSGPAVGKVISCAEIMKRQHQLHQVNKICFRKVKEFWDPVLEDLDPLVVVRELPTIHILLSKDPLDPSQPGYQAPNPAYSRRNNTSRQTNKPPRRRIESDKFESFGLRSARTKNKRKPNEQRGSNTSAQKTEPRGETRRPTDTHTDAGPSGVG